MSIRTKTKIHLYSAIVITIFAALSVSSYAEIYQHSNQPTIQFGASTITTTVLEQSK